MNKKIIFIIVALLVIVGGIALYSSYGKQDTNDLGTAGNQNTTFESDDVIAVVNGEEISGSDFNIVSTQVAAQQGINPATLDAQTQNQFASQIIRTLIAQVLLRQAAYQSGVVISEDDINVEIAAIKGQFESEEAFQQALSTQNLTEEDLRLQISESIIIDPYLEQELNLSTITATEEEVAETYEEVVATSDTEVAPLSDIYQQLEAMIIQQKMQELIAQFVEELRNEAEVEILI